MTHVHFVVVYWQTFIFFQQDTSASGTSTAGNASAGITTGVPKTQSKNGGIFTDGIKDTMIIAATKQLTKKDKRGSTSALQTTSIDTSDATYLDKSSPSLQAKRKSNSVDVTSNGPMAGIDLAQMSFSNGNPVINEEAKPSPTSANGDYTAGEGNLTDINSDLSSIISEHNSKPVTVSTANNNIQISQV